MALTAGSRFGPYEILALIGKGGMGEVYRAHDTQLEREVAIKALPEEFARDAERLARFEREAKLLASLNHPNIAAIYGLAESDQTRFLVLELVEGETLAERIAVGALPVEDALNIALQIAEALESAHERGVIHRDLKPSNIKVTPEGKVKVLDFGLAKAFAGNDSSSTLSNSPTLTMNATQQGVILGTAAYMAPEQARGKKVDHRSDIWSFGCVLYEMLTGHPVFRGEEVSDILASVLARDPDYTKLEGRLHPAVRKLLLRCLDKDPRNRWQSAGDVRFEIQELLREPKHLSGLPVAISPQVRRSWIGWVAAIILVAAAAAFIAWSLRSPRPDAVTRFDYHLPESHIFRNTGRPLFALSPDGRRFAYNTTRGFYVKELDSLEAHLIPGTEGTATSPFFSPDGQWLAYFDVGGNKLTKIAITGGAAIPLTPASNPFGTSWESDGTILYGLQDGIHRVSENGGTSELLVKATGGETPYGPQLLPGGEWVLFTAAKAQGARRWDQAEIVAQSLKTQERVVVWRGGGDARYVPTGHLVYALDTGLFAVPFDAKALKVTGGPVSVAQNVFRAVTPANNTAAANYSVSRNGSLAYVNGAGSTAGLRSLLWVDRRTMREEVVSAEPRAYAYPRISPDGLRVALDDRTDNDIQVWDLAAKTLTRFTFGSELEIYPAWTPGNDRIAYSAGRGILWKASNNTGTSTALVEGFDDSINELDPYFFSPDGSQIVFRALGFGNSREDIGMISIKPASKPVWLLHSQFNERNAELSPDGKWLAYQSDETGNPEIYVQPFPNLDSGRWQISNGGGLFPRWSKNTTELFYVQPGTNPAMMAAQFTAPRDFVLGSRVKLFDASAYFLTGPVGRPYDVSPRDGRFLMLKTQPTSQGGTPPPVVVVVENWFTELRQQAKSR
jgi:serine/threonine-protein kinase